MKKYKYNLDDSSTKFNCPNCGKKRFVKYVTSETGQYIEGNYGRCDRETNCGYSQKPNSNSTSYKTSEQHQPLKEPTYHSPELVKKSIINHTRNQFIQFLYSKYSEEIVKKMIKKYMIGTSKIYNGGTVFWQIDNSENVRCGKIMAYNSTTGKRKKRDGGTGIINWVHSVMKIPKFNLSQCLFGLHLLKNETKQVAIVESEKTALIMSLEIPKTTWMATGSLTGFKYEYLKPLKNVEIIAYPDKGGFDAWFKTGNELNKSGFNITVSEILEKEQYKTGWDLVDLIELNKVTLNYTRAEIITVKLYKKNPTISTLIKTFDLVDEYDQEIRDIPP